MSTQSKKGGGQKTRLLQAMLAAGLRVFETADVKKVIKELDINPVYTYNLLSGLARDNWIESVKKGVYRFASVTGISPIHEFEIAMHLVKPAMISYYSAFYHHGLTEQLPKIVYISSFKETATPQKGTLKKRSGFNLNGIEYQIIQLKKEKFYGGVQAWYGESCFLVSNLERTLLEGFARPQYCGGFSEVMHGLEESLERLNLQQLIGYARRWDIAAGRRIGWALEQLGIENEQTLSLAQVKHPGFRQLDPSGKPSGSYSSKWRLRINI